MFAIIIFEVWSGHVSLPFKLLVALSSIKGKELSMPYKPNVMAFLSLALFLGRSTLIFFFCLDIVFA